MNEPEGVIKFELHHAQTPLPAGIDVRPINAWRTLFYRLGLIGQNPERYDGYGFGNISFKSDNTTSQFIISGTQTGHLEKLEIDHYCMVTGTEIIKNRIYSTGLSKPSSEALTHACVYQQDSDIKAVIHVHSPELWLKSKELGLPYTPDSVLYGSPEMVMAVKHLFTSGQLNTCSIFSMYGHQDGIIAFGPSLEAAAWALIKCWVKSKCIE
ncbi:class II aldolase/adducin family protein [Methylicorpusculum sp.]|uniref:class II aldolase/adducin family protein n=1 Tax=Methylicorpusculum sp. TaxID=2713644 RepID=UPI00272FCD2F|nr:class II aldolase/adducin family protein [Methylicorpusculum sp.]MDP2177919.1 class II aldolase/adducin family protein [Methylicorpusculum sp.]MDP3528191.1 class II aldolase/adducin family protein [Methylicorpusculum sp.]MDZ4153336.1 class II aldolase/adducin family protein [Methylicorpusculum sp.]